MELQLGEEGPVINESDDGLLSSLRVLTKLPPLLWIVEGVNQISLQTIQKTFNYMHLHDSTLAQSYEYASTLETLTGEKSSCEVCIA